MFGVQDQLRNRHKIIVGIDYGTTFSGVSYVTTDKSDMNDITVITSWPGEPGSMWKTPTRIAYARQNPQIQKNKWGFEVYPKLVSYSWTKLLLDRNAAVGEHDDPALSKMVGSGMLQLPTFRQASGVCEDFLHEVYDHVSTKLRQQMTDLTFESTPMECWITLPAIWSDEAKDATLTAAKKAGFGNRTGDEVFTIAEPEAAAIATLREYAKVESFNGIKPNENVLICDCGGGTVDITTYVITQVTPRLEFEELHIGVGGKCGSTYIDRNLHALLSKRFRSKFDSLPFAQTGPGSKLMISFEKYKRDFGRNDEDQDQDIREIGPVRMDVPDSNDYDEDERMVKLTYDDMKALFKPVVEEIASLVGQQVEEARSKKNAKIDRIVLVGGFAESPYLHDFLSNWCWENGDITLLRPEFPQSAVVRGAALRGLEGIAPRKKHARRHYGVGSGQLFREGIDPEENSFVSQFDEKKYCDHRTNWMIGKGDEIVEGTFRTIEFFVVYTPGEKAAFQVTLFSCPLIEAPEYTFDSRVDKVGVIKSSFPAGFDYGTAAKSRFNTRLNRFVYSFDSSVEIIFGGRGSNLTFRSVVNGKVGSTTEIEFDQR